MSIKQAKVIIFDGDDTLWRTQELYDKVTEQFNELMKSQEFDENIVELLDIIDAQRVKILKFSKMRFLESMLITYGILCGKYRKTWNVEIEAKIRNFSDSIFKFPPKLYEDAIDILNILHKYFSLVLFTSGDIEIQKAKINSLGNEFKFYFEKIYIVEMKNEEEYKKIFNELGVHSQDVLVVGNGVKSDINPALKLGAKTILISHRTWKYEAVKPISDNILTASSLTEVKDLIFKTEKLK